MFDFDETPAEQELISWEEAEWTRQALGLSVADFAQLLGVRPSSVYHGQKNPQSFLSRTAAIMLTMGVNRRRVPGKQVS